MGLADFIDRNMDALLDDWVVQARQLCAEPAPSEMQLRDSARPLFTSIAQVMRMAQSDLERAANGTEERPAGEAAMSRIARVHADDRFGQGFSLNAVIAEYRAMRAGVVRRWLADGGGERPNELRDLVHFDEAVDQALAASVSRYLSEQERTRDLFVGILAHDLRTPLGAIAMSAQYLLQAQETPAHVLRVSANMQRSSASMQRIIEDLVDFTRTRLGGILPVHCQPADMGAICRQAIAEIEALHPGENIRWRSDGDLSGTWDTGRLGQLLTNLLQNAIDHGHAGRLITVTTQGTADMVQLSVHNEGDPIPTSAVHEIFDPLVRAPTESKPRRAGVGLGLGLFIARQIAVAHGGSLEAQPEDNGMTFTASLPRVGRSTA